MFSYISGSHYLYLALFTQWNWNSESELRTHEHHILQRDASNIFYQDRKDHEQEVLTNYDSCRNLTNQVADMLRLNEGSYLVI